VLTIRDAAHDARVLKTVVREGKEDEATRIALESIRPAAKEQPGNRGWILLTEGDVGLTISLCETKEDLLVRDQNGYLRAQIAKMAALEPATIGLNGARPSAGRSPGGDGYGGGAVGAASAHAADGAKAHGYPYGKQRVVKRTGGQ
jgi:hypothetical protein